MDLSSISTTILGFSGTYTPWLLLAIFVITLLTQFGLFVPYLLESIWLFSGYNVILGIIPPLFLVALCVVGVIGREVGSGAFYYASSAGSLPLQRMFRRHIEPRLIATEDRHSGPVKRALLRLSRSIFDRHDGEQSLKLFGRPLRFSPFTVALGHFLWMRVPITLSLGLKRKVRPLLLGVALFSIIFDGMYIMLGVLGGVEGVNRSMMMVYPLGLMAAVFGISYGVRRMFHQA